LELAGGIAVTKDFVAARSLLVTDFGEGDWLDRGGVDALATPFGDDSFDFVLIQNAIHHLARPVRLFDEMARIIRPHGRLFIRDVKCSLMMRLATRATRVEGYNFEVDVFDPEALICDPADPWASNNAVPDLLFDDLNRFHAHIRSFRVLHQHLDEFLLFLLSGGVTNKTFTIPLSRRVLTKVGALDTALTRRFPGTLAMQRSLVLERC
jgi:SAM-dependent methyltransferase